MHKWRLTKILVVVAAGLALAAGSVAAVAATRDGDDETPRTTAQEGTGVEQPWLGIVARPSEEPAGLAVRHVAPESPAADSGIEPGDVITAIDGTAVTEFDALAEAIGQKAVGDTVTLSVIKNGVEEPQGEPTDIEVTLEARPDRAYIKEHIDERIGKLFDRFVDGQFRYLDEEGNTVTIEVFAGTVKSVSADEITLDINGDEGDKTFSIPDGVEVPDIIDEGDRAGVVVKDGEVQHVIGGGFPFLPGIVPGLPDGLPQPFQSEGGIFPRPFRGGGGIPFDCRCEEPAPEPQEAAPEA